MKPWALLAVALGLTTLSVVCTFTPLAWILEGRPAETYPELFFFIYWLPASVLLIADAGLLLWLKSPVPGRWLWRSAALKLAGIAMTLPLFVPGVKTWPQIVLDLFPLVVIGGGVVLTGIAVTQAWCRRRDPG